MNSSQVLPFIVLVDDEQDILFTASHLLAAILPNQVATFSNSSDILTFLKGQHAAVIVLDLQMPGFTGQELLPQIVYNYPEIQVIIMTGANSIDTAVACMKMGAFDYLVKPVDNSRLVSSVTRALEVHRLRGEVTSLKRYLLSDDQTHHPAFASIITRNRKIKGLFHYLESIACSPQPVLISGETGVGKELFARAIHAVSGKKGEFVALNIAGLDDLMFSDTLFGHWKGAYTGASHLREGLIAKAAGGTLFLDEIGDLNLMSQVKLLRLLQENEYYPLGSDMAKRSSARVVVATNRNLPQMIAAGEFRNDLYFRLNTHSCHVPPLRERQEDLPLLVEHFLHGAAATLKKKAPPSTEEFTRSLRDYSFPGNIRELQAMITDVVAHHSGGPLSAEFFIKKLGVEQHEAESTYTPLHITPEQVHPDPASFPKLKDAEMNLIQQALSVAYGNQGVAATLLGISRKALNNRLSRTRKTK